MATTTANSVFLPDVLVYVVAPLTVTAAVGAVAWLAHLAHRVALLATRVAVLESEVTPDGQTSLRAMVTEIRVTVASIAARLP